MSVRIGVVGGPPVWRRGMQAMLGDAGLETATFDALDEWRPGVGGRAVVVYEPTAEQIAGHDESYPLIPLIAAIGSASVARRARLMRDGATSVVGDEDGGPEVAAVISGALAGFASIPTPVARAMAESVPEDRDTRAWVTEEEERWLQAMAEGRTVAELADDTGYSERAMFRLLRGLYTRLGVTNRTEAIVWASRHGLLA